MQKPIYIHYGSTFFEPSRNFPISNHRNWSKPFGWYGSEYKDKKADDMYFGLYGWDCDSIVILNPSVVVPI